MAKRKSTQWRKIGRSNWYRRFDASGNLVKRQGSAARFKRNNRIITGIKTAVRKRLIIKPTELDENVFQRKRPSQTVEIIIRRDGEVFRTMRVEPENYFMAMLEIFNLMYDSIQTGEEEITFEQQPV